MAKKKEVKETIAVSIHKNSLCTFVVTGEVIDENTGYNLGFVRYLPMRNVKAMFKSRFGSAKVIEYTDGSLEKYSDEYDESLLSDKFKDSFMLLDKVEEGVHSILVPTMLTKENIEELARNFKDNMTITDYSDKPHMQYDIDFSNDDKHDGFILSTGTIKESSKYGVYGISLVRDLINLIDSEEVVVKLESYGGVKIKYIDSNFGSVTQCLKSIKDLPGYIKESKISDTDIRKLTIPPFTIFISKKIAETKGDLIKDFLNYHTKDTSIYKAKRRLDLSISLEF